MKQILTLGIISLLISCTPDGQLTNFEVQGLTPLYADEWTQIDMESPRAITQLGKMYYHQGLLLINEKSQGIHILDNTDPENPTPLAFLSVPGNVDIAAKGDLLFIDNYSDLLSIQLNQDLTFEIKSRTKGVFDHILLDSPDESYTGYFECPDPTKGPVQGWESTSLTNPKCRK